MKAGLKNAKRRRIVLEKLHFKNIMSPNKNFFLEHQVFFVFSVSLLNLLIFYSFVY